ncbi:MULTISPECIES: hypothetical protein [Methylophilus]|uniref:hypothetical protein n=1 Tax=Methylophilus TaxID=16 RepID=UPI000F5A02E0|nr:MULTISPECIES: hypothetical protein [Methylophilus]
MKQNKTDCLAVGFVFSPVSTSHFLAGLDSSGLRFCDCFFHLALSIYFANSDFFRLAIKATERIFPFLHAIQIHLEC